MGLGRGEKQPLNVYTMYIFSISFPFLFSPNFPNHSASVSKQREESSIQRRVGLLYSIVEMIRWFSNLLAEGKRQEAFLSLYTYKYPPTPCIV